jgi:hypothetical protein
MGLDQTTFQSTLQGVFESLFAKPITDGGSTPDTQMIQTIEGLAAEWAAQLASAITDYIKTADISGVSSSGTANLATGSVSTSQTDTVHPS